MRIPYADFEAWGRSVSGERRFSLNMVAKTSGFWQSRLALQQAKGYIEPYVVLAYSQAIGLAPFEELSRFAGYEVLYELELPEAEERLAGVPVTALYEEALARLAGADRTYDGSLDADHAFNRWISTVVEHGGLARIADAMEMARPVFYQKIRSGKWSVAQLVEFCDAGGLNHRWAAVMQGQVPLEHSGFAPDILQSTLRTITNNQLVSAITAAADLATERMDARQLEERIRNELS